MAVSHCHLCTTVIMADALYPAVPRCTRVRMDTKGKMKASVSVDRKFRGSIPLLSKRNELWDQLNCVYRIFRHKYAASTRTLQIHRCVRPTAMAQGSAHTPIFCCRWLPYQREKLFFPVLLTRGFIQGR